MAAARRSFRTKIRRKVKEHGPAPTPPRGQLRFVRYQSPIGRLGAFISLPPIARGRHPAIIWLIGGFSNGLGKTPWRPRSPRNDQSASIFWKSGIITMYPSRRGGNDNPGQSESFYGEVDDVMAAAAYLAKQPFVDPKRIYLGGHSTGGTLALLVAASTARFRAVFSLGPVAKITDYGASRLVFDATNRREVKLRSPIDWLHAIRTPTFVFEGVNPPVSNRESLERLRRAYQRAKLTPGLLRFFAVPRADHFSVIAPISKAIARKILRDKGPKLGFSFSSEEIGGLFPK